MSVFRVTGLSGWLLLILLVGVFTAGGILLGTTGWFTSPVLESAATDAAGGDDKNTWYTCGMHPNVLQRGPGICPICNMKLTPRKEESEEDSDASGPEERRILYWRSPMDPNHVSDQPGEDELGMDFVPVYGDEGDSASGKVIRIEPVTIQNMGVRTARVARGPLAKIIRTLGRVDYNEQKVVFVDTKYSGWIEKLHVDQTGQHIRAGDPLFEVYSPELYSAQVEYLSAIRKLPLLEKSTLPEAVEDAHRMVEAGRIKLEYYDVPADEIERIAGSKEIRKTLAMRSPADGIVTEKMALQGMRVEPGTRLFTIADLSRVWVYVDVYEYQLPWIHVGQDAVMTLPYIPGQVFRGKVVYIYPYLQKETRVIKIRLEFDNPELQLKPDMYANVLLESTLRDDAVLIPREAYIDSGTRKLVFVDRGGGKFQPRDIQVGVEGEDGKVEVAYGLEAGEVVVTSGQFMLDAESKLKDAVAKMMEAERVAVRKKRVGGLRVEGLSEEKGSGLRAQGSGSEPFAASQPSILSPPPSALPPDAAYACPMDKHPAETDPSRQGAYFSPQPGDCPWCGMKLKPLDELGWVQVLRAAEGGDVAYTCPDHTHVYSTTEGDCPRCGRSLEPFKAMYTCRRMEHSGVISTFDADCPRCQDPLVVFRGPWLSPAMERASDPPNPSFASAAAYRCPRHPLVHSDSPGSCPQCGADLQPTERAEATIAAHRIPPDAKFTCPMRDCWQFSPEPGRCVVCGMNLEPIADVDWAASLRAAAPAPVAEKTGDFVCPMHPEKVSQSSHGTCSICAMELVPRSSVVGLATGSDNLRRQMDYIMEHYLGLQSLLASDKTLDAARHALGLVDAAEKLKAELEKAKGEHPAEVLAAAAELHVTALKITGEDLDHDRALFGPLSAAMRTLLGHVRPDKQRWPKLNVFHCPMSRGNWIQPGDKKANPYYGFKMLDCGKLVETK